MLTCFVPYLKWPADGSSLSFAHAPLGNPSPIRASWEEDRKFLTPFPFNPGEGVLCQLMANISSKEAGRCFCPAPLAFVLFKTWIYMEDKRLEPKAFKIGRDEKNCRFLRFVDAFCSVDELVFVLWGSFSLPLTVHHILFKIIITSLMWI